MLLPKLVELPLRDTRVQGPTVTVTPGLNNSLLYCFANPPSARAPPVVYTATPHVPPMHPHIPPARASHLQLRHSDLFLCHLCLQALLGLHETQHTVAAFLRLTPHLRQLSLEEGQLRNDMEKVHMKRGIAGVRELLCSINCQLLVYRRWHERESTQQQGNHAVSLRVCH